MRRILFVLSSVALLMCACNWNEVGQYTPQVTGGAFMVCVGDSAVDTLKINGGTTMDTIHVGDSVVFSALMQSFANNLVSFSVGYDTAAFRVRLHVDSIKVVVDPTSMLDEGVLRFRTGYNGAVFPVSYVAKKAGAHHVTLTVESDSQYSTQTVEFIQPVQ